VASHSTCTEDRPSLRRLLVFFAQQLVDGSALDTEALVDVLTLKDTPVVGSRDSVIALEKLLRDTVSAKSCWDVYSQLMNRHYHLVGGRWFCFRYGEECIFETSEF
jgi:hypothetical protein